MLSRESEKQCLAFKVRILLRIHSQTYLPVQLFSWKTKEAIIIALADASVDGLKT